MYIKHFVSLPLFNRILCKTKIKHDKDFIPTVKHVTEGGEIKREINTSSSVDTRPLSASSTWDLWPSSEWGLFLSRGSVTPPSEWDLFLDREALCSSSSAGWRAAHGGHWWEKLLFKVSWAAAVVWTAPSGAENSWCHSAAPRCLSRRVNTNCNSVNVVYAVAC